MAHQVEGKTTLSELLRVMGGQDCLNLQMIVLFIIRWNTAEGQASLRLELFYGITGSLSNACACSLSLKPAMHHP